MLEKKERNLRIYQDRQKGLSWRALVQKYDLSETRLRQIVGQEKAKRING